MASYNRPRFFAPNNNQGFHRNNFEQSPIGGSFAPIHQNFEQNSHQQFQCYPFPNPSMGQFAGGRPQFPVGNVQMQGPPLYRSLPRQMGPSGMLNRPYVEDNGMFRSPAVISQMRMPFPNETCFVPWNQRPESFVGNRMSVQNARRAATQAVKPAANNTTKSKERKIKNKLSFIRDDGKKLKPWMTDEIYAEIKKKNELYVKAKNGENTDLWQEFKLQRNRVGSLIKEAKLKNGFITHKVKEEKDEPARPFSCDTCDRAFVQESELRVHYKEHVKCGVNGCPFEAHTKVVEFHKKLQHDTGYADAILKLNDAGEIEKWRNERRSHYPTAENIKKRKAEQDEKIARGEVIETKDFGKFKKRREERHQSTGYARKERGGKVRGRFRRQRGLRTEWNPPLISKNDDSDSDDHIKLKKFPGLLALNQQSRDSNDERPAVEPSQKASQNTPLDISMNDAPKPVPDSNDEGPAVEASQKTLQNTSLAISMNDVPKPVPDSNNEGPAVEPIQKTSQNTPLAVSMNDAPKAVPDSNDEGPAVEPIQKTSQNTPLAISTNNVPKPVPVQIKENGSTPETSNVVKMASGHHQNARLHKHTQNFPISLKKPNLLDKLLANEIRHERNVILQCVRHVVNNRFFGVGTD